MALFVLSFYLSFLLLCLSWAPLGGFALALMSGCLPFFLLVSLIRGIHAEKINKIKIWVKKQNKTLHG